MSKTQPQFALTFVAPTAPCEDDEDTTLLLIHRRARTRPPQWNPPLPLTVYRELLGDD